MKAKMKNFFTKKRIIDYTLNTICVLSIMALSYWFMWEYTEQYMR